MALDMNGNGHLEDNEIEIIMHDALKQQQSA